MATTTRAKVTNKPSLKSQGAGASVTNRAGVTTYYKSAKDTPGYSDTANGKNVKTSAGKSISQVDKVGNVITPQSLAPNTAITVPQKPVVAGVPDIAALNQGLAGGTTGITTDATGKFTVTAPTDTTGTDKYAGLTNLFNEYTKQSQAIDIPSQEDIYNKQYKADGIKQKQQAVNDYTSQLNTIVANRDANVLKVEGQGRGITETIIGGQQAQINKEAAIAALPVQAQLAAAQGNLEMAQSHLDTMFKLKSADATAQYNYKTKLLDSVYNFATGIEQKKLDDLKVKEERTYQEKQTFIKAQQAALSNALGQGAPASVYNAIKNATDLNGVTIAAGIYNGDVLGQQLKRAQIASANRANQPSAPNEYGTLTGKPQNVSQSAANGYADRIAQANTSLSLLGKKFTGQFAFGDNLPNALQSGDRQAYEQAKNNFATAVLRRESGASIAPSEFETLEKTYFPTRGDKPEVVAQKEALRNTVINSFYRESNVPRPVISGDVIEDNNGVLYRVGIDGETLEPIE